MILVLKFTENLPKEHPSIDKFISLMPLSVFRVTSIHSISRSESFIANLPLREKFRIFVFAG